MNEKKIIFVLKESIVRWMMVQKFFCIVLFLCAIPLHNAGAQETTDIETIFVEAISAMNDGNMPLAKSQFEWLEENIEPTDIEGQMTIQYLLIKCDMALGNYNNAIKHFNHLAILNNDGLHSELMIWAYCAILPAYEELKDWRNGDTVSEYIERALLKEDVLNEYKWDMLSVVVGYYISKGTYDHAIAIWQNLCDKLEIDESQLNELSLRTINVSRLNVHMSLAICYMGKQDYQNALNHLQNSLQYISEDTMYNESIIYYMIAECLSHLNEDASALIYYEKVKNSASSDEKELQAKNSISYGARLFLCHQIPEAINQFTYALEHQKEVPEYIPYCYAYLYKCYRSIGETETAENYANLLSESMKTIVNVDNEQYSICLSTYGDILKNRGDYENALYIYENALKIKVSTFGTNSPQLASIIYTLGSLSLIMGNYDKADSYIDTALKITKGLSDYLPEYIDATIIKAEILYKKGNLGKAVSMLEVLSDTIESLSYDDEIKINYYSTLGGMYGALGEYQKDLEYEKQAAKYAEQHYGNQSPAYAVSILNLSELYAVLGEKEKSMQLNQEALGLMEKLYGKNSENYYQALKKMASCYHNDAPNEAISIYEQCLCCAENLFGDESSEYAECLIALSELKFKESANEKYLKDYSRGLEIKRKIGKDNDVYYFTFLNLLSSYYAYLGNLEATYELEKEYYTKVKQYIIDNFQNMVEWQREKLWDFLQAPFIYIPARAGVSFSPNYIKLAYNSLLLRKSLLLTSINTISKLVADSENTELITLHEEINKDNAELLKATTAEDYTRIQNEIFTKQRRELEEIKQFGIIADFLDKSWEDIANALNVGEVAIEFFAYPSQDCTSYGALILKSHSIEPEIIPLFNDEEEVFKNYKMAEKEKYDYDNYELYKLVWDRIDKYCLDGVHSIYFAPDGILHTMPIEYLRDGNGVFASDKWNIYRLSSTREIINRDPKLEYNSIVLYGGLNYDLDRDDLIAESRSSDYHTNNATRATDVTNLRYGVTYLPGTKEEVEKIGDLFKTAQIKYQTIIGNAGTEESFRSLGNDINIIHLATHGFFWTDDEVEKRGDASFIQNINNLQRYEDKALLRSGLIFTGANIGLRGDELPDDVEDGVLTAQELSSMNLGNVDLVVLSACQSGLGETSGEGVFGLQRGFKLAGANTLLMSLWKVDDTATQMLMTEFYNNLLSGQSKVESLLNAQQYVKSQPNFSDPYYWAGFILLDAIN